MVNAFKGQRNFSSNGISDFERGTSKERVIIAENSSKTRLMRNTFSPNPIKLAHTRHILYLLKNSQEQYIDAIIDSMIVAANQVQDKRLEVLEKPPVTLEDVLFDIMFELLPSGRIFRKAIKDFTKTHYESLLKTRFAFSTLAKSNYPVLLQVELKDVLTKAEKIQMKEYFLRNNELRDLYSASAIDFFENIDTRIEAATKNVTTSKNILDKIDKLMESVPPTDTPGTVVTNQVFTVARRFKYSQIILIEYIERILNIVDSDESLDEIVDFSCRQIEAIAGNYESMKNAYNRWFELLIWIAIYNPQNIESNSITVEDFDIAFKKQIKFKAKKRKDKIEQNNQENQKDVEDIKWTITEPIVTYLIERILKFPYFELEHLEDVRANIIGLGNLWVILTKDISNSKKHLIPNLH